MTTLIIPLAGLALVATGLLVVLIGLRSARVDEVSRRLEKYVVEPAAPQKQWPMELSRQEELKGSFRERILLPAFKGLGRFFGRLTPAKALDDLSRQLTVAGSPFGLGAREFYGLRLALTLLGFWLAFVFIRNGISQNNLILAALSVIICSYLPKQWLKGRVRKRQNAVRKGLPDALDMLSVCAEAGLGFDQALLRVSEHWKTPVGLELGRVVAEMEMGLSRRQALRSLAERLDLPELSSFVAVVLQSEQLGMSMADTLTSQAQQMRTERRFRAQEQARKIPLKMLFPMLLLILPAMFAVILGPSIPVLSDFFDNLLVTAGS